MLGEVAAQRTEGCVRVGRHIPQKLEPPHITALLHIKNRVYEKPLLLITRGPFQLFCQLVIVLFETFDIDFEARQLEL